MSVVSVSVCLVPTCWGVSYKRVSCTSLSVSFPPRLCFVFCVFGICCTRCSELVYSLCANVVNARSLPWQLWQRDPSKCLRLFVCLSLQAGSHSRTHSGRWVCICKKAASYFGSSCWWRLLLLVLVVVVFMFFYTSGERRPVVRALAS